MHRKYITSLNWRVVQILSRVVTLIFLAALIWAIYQAVVNRNPLPVWAWLGMVVLFAVAIGLGVAVAVYRGVAKQTGRLTFANPAGSPAK